jgi:eukaryotic translation initiation factor 2C
VGIVASVDSNLAQWPAAIRIQDPKQEMVSALDQLLKSRLRLWRERNSKLPENILVYRDGISEGQYKITLDKEVPLIRKACQEMYPAFDTKKGLPLLTMVIVGKRHHTRFYPTKEGDADRSSNPCNGTVVDRGVTKARNWDFFLQAHTALLGTARPAHYFVVLDEIFRKGSVANPADDLEKLTHNMCYLFGRATKAVSICPPAYYADLVCERARCYLSGHFDGTAPGGEEGQNQMRSKATIHDAIKDSMFYI